MYFLRSIILQLQFFTSIPLPFTVRYDEKKFVESIVFLPLVGLLIGSLLVASYYLIMLLEKRVLAVVMVLIVEIVLTGGLHLDGLADSCDGLFSNRKRDEILAIMKDSRNGTNALLGVFSLLSLKGVLLFLLEERYTAGYLFVMPVISRMAVVWSAGLTRYARKEKGMGNAIVVHTGAWQIVMVTLITLIISWSLIAAMTLPCVLGVVFFILLFAVFVTRRIGGSTGDTLGASIEIAEVVILFVAFSVPPDYYVSLSRYL